MNSRSSRPEVFCKKGTFKNFAKFKGKHACQSLLQPRDPLAAELPAVYPRVPQRSTHQNTFPSSIDEMLKARYLVHPKIPKTAMKTRKLVGLTFSVFKNTDGIVTFL